MNQLFETSRISLTADLDHIPAENDDSLDTIDERIEEVTELKNNLYKSTEKPPIKNGPMKIIRNSLEILLDELNELHLRVGEYQYMKEHP